MEIKITAELKGEAIRVKAEYFRKEEKVHEVNTAFVIGTSEEEIRAELEKQAELFEQEEKSAKKQAKVDKQFEEAKSIIDNLNS